jgi:hypothetical protein
MGGNSLEHHVVVIIVIVVIVVVEFAPQGRDEASAPP